ncbi:hypothetical protein TNCV_3866761 [Trichonephila clavipes]|nr:hypothetical protein TNCV_3866761 [Trichonephila clavipes]
MTPELVPGSTFQLSTDLTCIAALHGGSLVVLRTQTKPTVRYLTTWNRREEESRTRLGFMPKLSVLGPYESRGGLKDRISICSSNLAHHKREQFLDHLVTGDESGQTRGSK